MAVMGFKCRVMQLQGELEATRRDLRKGNSKEETERLERDNHRLESELKVAIRERDAARKQGASGGSSRAEKVRHGING